MKQAVMIKPGKIEIRDVPEPKPGKGEVLLRIKRIGVCGSDIHVWHGKHPYTSYPVVQGHEFSGIVEEVGEGVENIRVGSKATAVPQIVCGKCGPCLRGDYHICDNLKVEGFQAPGVAQELFVTTTKKIVPLPDSFSFEDGALVEPASCAVHAVNRIAILQGKDGRQFGGWPIENKNVVVFGGGPIGNLVAQVARAKGANVLISEISDFRLEVAKQCGLENVTNPKRESFKKAIMRVFGDKGFEIGFECVGIEQTMQDAIENIQKGGTIIVMGVFAEHPRVNLGFVQDRELKLIGTLMYKYEDYLEAVDLINSDKIVTRPLYSKHYPFTDYEEAYRYIDKQRDKVMKVFIDL
ncbi:MAG: alcohol dehydrogenase catalytic domain-containing protein [Caldisericaceae bacterium]|nr:alcohol dehydrogenase catalytic domain-containing protein [Caldisericaceae bacterium]